MIEILRGIFAVAFIFSFAIFIHELGHFMFAKLFKVKVETFSIGFGKKLLKFRRGETEYCLSAVPFGGYVKMVGIHSKEMEKIIEGDKPATVEEQSDASLAAAELAAPAPVTLGQGIINEVDALRSKPWWQKFLVFSAGCMNNFLTAAVVFFLMDWVGHMRPEPVPVVIEAVEPIPLLYNPLQAGDRVVGVAGKPIDGIVDFFEHVTKQTKTRKAGSTIDLAVLRNGTTTTVELPIDPPTSVTLPSGEITKVGDKSVGSTKAAQELALTALSKNQTGPIQTTVRTKDGNEVQTTVSPLALLREQWWRGAYNFKSPAFIASPLPNLPAEKAGLQFGDEIVSVNGQPVDSALKATKTIRQNVGKTIPIEVKRGDEKKGFETVAVNIEVRPDPEDPTRGQIGVFFGEGPLRKFVKKPFGEALKDGFAAPYLLTLRYIDGIQNLFRSSFQTVRENVGGPIAIGTQAVKNLQRGWAHYFNFFAVFNVILAVTNLLPLPVFDGGHILFSTIEAIIRRPLPAKFMLFVYNAFTLLIIGLALAITFNDVVMNFWRLF